MPKHICTLWNLWANWEILAPNQLKLDNCVIQGIVGKIKEFIGQGLRSLRRSMIEIIKEIFLPKTGMQKAISLQDPGYVEEVEDCVLHAACCRGIFVIIVEDVEDGPSYYIVYYNSNYSNKEILWTNASNYSLFQIKSLYKFELQLLWIRQQLKSLQIGATLN